MLTTKIILYALIFLGLLFSQSILSIYFDFIPDLLFLYIIINSLLKNRAESIVCGFLFGFFQDCITQGDLLGINALTKTFLSFFIGSVKLYDDVWTSLIKKIVIQLSILFCYLLFFFIKDNGNIIISEFLSSIFFHSIFTMIIMLLINRFVTNSKLF